MTAPLHMTPNEWDQVAAILSEHLAARRIWAFGSRATGRRLKQFSDLDLAISGTLTWEQRAELTDAFDESLLPFKVDFVEIDTLDPAFRARIEPDLLPISLSQGTRK